MESLWLRSLRPGALRLGLWPALALVAVLYRVASLAKRAIFGLGLFPRTRLGAFTVSVGNLAVGGTGKTPVTQAIARILSSELGVPTAVLCRGYGSRNRERVRWLSRAGRLEPDAGAGGDEAFLLARSLSAASVLVGKRRALTGRAAERAGHRAVVLDDGFQYWRLERDLDVVCFSALWPLEAYRPFPLGLLREGWARLRQARFVVVTGRDAAPPGHFERLTAHIRGVAPEAELLEAAFRIRTLSPLGRLESLGGLELIAGKRVLAVSNIVNPGRFRAALLAAGPVDVEALAFGDHHAHEPAGVAHILDTAVAKRVNAIVATEKDEQSLLDVAPPPGAIPFYVARGEVELAGDGLQKLGQALRDGVT